MAILVFFLACFVVPASSPAEKAFSCLALALLMRFFLSRPLPMKKLTNQTGAHLGSLKSTPSVHALNPKIFSFSSARMFAHFLWLQVKNFFRFVFFFVIFLTNILGLFIVHMIVSVSLRCLNRQAFRKVQRFFEGFFVKLLISMIQLISDSQFVISLPEQENVELTAAKFAKIFQVPPAADSALERDILISNHVLYSDWIYLWGLMDRIGRAGEVKIIMKRSLRNVPIFGWSMRYFDFIFLNRKWEQDQAHFKKKLKGFVDSESPFCLLIFPEGTTINANSRAKSESFAQKMGVKPTAHVLLPRVLGLWEAVKGLDEGLGGIYDVTVGYSDLKPTDEPEKIFSLMRLFWNGSAPAQIHYHLQYIPLKQIPRDSAEAFSEWLRERYYAKDALLDEFYANGQFPASQRVTKRLCPRYFWLTTALSTMINAVSLYFWFLLVKWFIFEVIIVYASKLMT